MVSSRSKNKHAEYFLLIIISHNDGIVIAKVNAPVGNI